MLWERTMRHGGCVQQDMEEYVACGRQRRGMFFVPCRLLLSQSAALPPQQCCHAHDGSERGSTGSCAKHCLFS